MFRIFGGCLMVLLAGNVAVDTVLGGGSMFTLSYFSNAIVFGLGLYFIVSGLLNGPSLYTEYNRTKGGEVK